MLYTNDYTGIARAIIANGHPITIGWYDDGDAESGPRGGSWAGYRWGQLTITLGTCWDRAHVESRAAADSPYGPRTGYPIVWGATTDPEILEALRAIAKKGA